MCIRDRASSHEKQQASADSVSTALEMSVGKIQSSLVESTRGVFDGLEALSLKLTEQQAAADTARLETWSRSLEDKSELQKVELNTITERLTTHLTELSNVQAAHSETLNHGLGELTSEWKDQLRGLQAETVESQQELVGGFKRAVEQMHREAQASEAERLSSIEKLLSESEQLLRVRVESEAKWSEQHREQLGLLSLIHI